MSWKADKFQPLRDRNRSRAISFSPQVAELQARKARIDSVTAALRDPERPAHDDFMDAFRWSSTQMDKFKRTTSAKIIKPPTFDLDDMKGLSAHALIVDDICGVRTGAASTTASPTRAEVMAKIARVDQLMRTQADEAKALAEITRELRGEPEPTPEYDRPMRFSYGYDFGVKRDQSVVAISGV